MKRVLLNLLTGLSLLLCVAVCALWVRSYCAWDFVEGGSRSAGKGQAVQTAWAVGVEDGVVTVGRQTVLWPAQNDASLNVNEHGWKWETRRPNRRGLFFPKGVWERLGFSYAHETTLGHPSPEAHDLTLSFPFWLPAALAALLPAARFYRRLRAKHPPGHCRRCGYDLTGNESGTCPECGQRR